MENKDLLNQWLIYNREIFNIIKSPILQEIYIAEKIINKEDMSFSYLLEIIK
jgi:hypothetical protein